MKICSNCKENKELTEYYPHNKTSDGLQSHCKTCHANICFRWGNTDNGRIKKREAMQRWRKNNPEKAKEKALFYSRKNKDKYKKRKKEMRQILVQNVMKKYGGICICCKETNWKFLTLDHKNDNGRAHRKTIKTGSLYLWAAKNDYPNTLQLMCFNCNCARYMRGGKEKICPHKQLDKID